MVVPHRNIGHVVRIGNTGSTFASGTIALFDMETRMNQIEAVASAINRYFDLMYDADDAKFPEVFHSACLVHGMRDGKLVAWSAAEFRAIMHGRPSPAAMQAPRDQQILSIECIAADLAAARLRVRIGQTCFIDHLTYHCIDGKWLVTSKAFHVALVFPPGP